MLRLLPVILFPESLTQVITLFIVLFSALIAKYTDMTIASITAIALSMVVLVLWIFGSTIIYGLIDLSHYFKYSWYLHISYFVLKTVTLVLDSIVMVADKHMERGLVLTFDIITDEISSVRQFAGMIAIAFCFLGLKSVLDKMGCNDLSEKCRKYYYIILITGLIIAIVDIINHIVTAVFPENTKTLTFEYLPFLILYSILYVFLLIVSVPAFLTAKSCCRMIYDTLMGSREG